MAFISVVAFLMVLLVLASTKRISVKDPRVSDFIKYEEITPKPLGFKPHVINITIEKPVPGQRYDENITHDIGERSTTAPIACFWTNSGKGGSKLCVNIDHFGYSNMDTQVPATFWKSLSSLQIYNSNYMIMLCTGQYYSGYQWGFRTTVEISNLNNYPNMNDATESIQIISRPSNDDPGWKGAVTLFASTGYTGRSIYVEGGRYPILSNAAYYGSGSLAASSLQSIILFYGTSITIYKDESFEPDTSNGEEGFEFGSATHDGSFERESEFSPLYVKNANSAIIAAWEMTY